MMAILESRRSLRGYITGRNLILLVLAVMFLGGKSAAQAPGTTHPTDGSTPLGMSPGAPAGSWYRLYYNQWGEMARVELPTGGAFEYEWDGGPQTLSNGVYSGGPPSGFAEYSIYRRVTTKRIYPDGGSKYLNSAYETNQKAKQHFDYDSNNNVTDSWEYDFGAGTFGGLVRHKKTVYMNTTGYTGTGDAAPNLLSLPTEEYVYDSAEQMKAKTTYEYDTYMQGLADRTNISGHARTETPSKFTASYLTRGNMTAVTR